MDTAKATFAASRDSPSTRLPQFSREPFYIRDVDFTKIGVRDVGLKVGVGELGTVAAELGACEIGIDKVCARQVGEPEIRRVRLFFVGGPISLFGGGEAGGNWIRQGVVRSGGGSGGRRYFCRQRPMGDFRWSSRAS